MMNILKTLSVSLLALAPVATLAHDHKHQHGEAEHVAEGQGLRVLHAWMAEPEGDEARIYMEIENQSDAPLVLLGAEGDFANSFGLSGMVLQNGVSVAVDLPELIVPAQREMDLEPGGAAILATGLTEHLHEGDVEEIHVLFEGQEIEVDVMVLEHGARQHPHAGHNH